MDLRQRKTQRALKNAFLQLRANKPLEKITIKELTDLAEVSKATFYLHYKDIYDISEQMQKDVIIDIYSNISHPELIFISPRNFAEELHLAFESKKHLINILFSDNQEAKLLHCIDAELKKYIFSLKPELKNNIKFNVFFSYSVYGGYYSFVQGQKAFNSDEVFEEILKFTDMMSNGVYD